MKISRFMQGVNAHKILAPLVKVSVCKWHRRDTKFNHHWMGLTFQTIAIKLFFEQFINCLVDLERRPVRTFYLQSAIKPKTTWTLFEKLDFTTADFISHFLAWLIRHAPFPQVTHLSKYSSRRGR